MRWTKGRGAVQLALRSAAAPPNLQHGWNIFDFGVMLLYLEVL